MGTAIRIDGKARAHALAGQIAADTAELVERHGVRPGLAVVIVGEDPASQVYVRNKERSALACGFHSVKHELPADVTEAQVLDLVATLNADETVHGILVQLPLPGHLDEGRITQSILPAKDVDGFHYINIGKLAAGDTQDAFVPCTPAGCMLLIEDQLGRDLSGKSAVVVGRSNIVGKPMASLLLAANATVTIAHSRTRDLPSVCRGADIVVAAVGRPNLVKGDWIREGAVVIDVGINRVETEEDGVAQPRLTGDVDFAAASRRAAAVTPVPGGVGPMTIAMLMANTLRAARLAAGLPG
ncbi:MAG TPA: bifunctional methylenetetrahydrofolate dehydrogenase/methenyltetrahydrofolate cyclohydrolase FolD [Woeseiaceae bacterium]|nr:bifunctional methylenetetrahydrofolate dehydrogenase/methenyltetrahydrofolate cyclohydrolase FolD [Woeseiaceae bacterium]